MDRIMKVLSTWRGRRVLAKCRKKRREKGMNNLTASEIAGLGVGALLLTFSIAAPKVDSFISSSQRTSLGMCKKCGDVRMIACSKCKGIGLVSESGPFNFNMMDDLIEALGGETKPKTLKCRQCQARGRFSCPDCSQ